MKLNIYDRKTGDIVKTYETEAYRLFFGTLEDVANAVDLDSLQEATDIEILKLVTRMITGSLGTVKDLMMDIFPGITEEELRCTYLDEQAAVLVEVVLYTFEQMAKGVGRKNPRRDRAS